MSEYETEATAIGMDGDRLRVIVTESSGGFAPSVVSLKLISNAPPVESQEIKGEVKEEMEPAAVPKFPTACMDEDGRLIGWTMGSQDSTETLGSKATAVSAAANGEVGNDITSILHSNRNIRSLLVCLGSSEYLTCEERARLDDLGGGRIQIASERGLFSLSGHKDFSDAEEERKAVMRELKCSFRVSPLCAGELHFDSVGEWSVSRCQRLACNTCAGEILKPTPGYVVYTGVKEFCPPERTELLSAAPTRLFKRISAPPVCFCKDRACNLTLIAGPLLNALKSLVSINAKTIQLYRQLFASAKTSVRKLSSAEAPASNSSKRRRLV